MAWRATLLFALLGVAAVSAGLVGTSTKCTWTSATLSTGGICNAAPAFVVEALPAHNKTPTPLSVNLLRRMAFKAACQVHTTKATCEARAHDSGCDWELVFDGEKPSCTVAPDWADIKLAQLGLMHGCPGSAAHAVQACTAAESPAECSAVTAAKCAWLEESEVAAAMAEADASADEFPAAVGLQRRRLLQFEDDEPPGFEAEVAEVAQEGDAVEEAAAVTTRRPTLLAPDGDALAGCVPAAMHKMVAARDIAALDGLNAHLAQGTGGSYGSCDKAVLALLKRCAALIKLDSCTADAACLWDGECGVKQGSILGAMLGDASPAAARALGCHARKTEADCLAAGEFSYNPVELGKGLVDGPEHPVMAMLATETEAGEGEGEGAAPMEEAQPIYVGPPRVEAAAAAPHPQPAV